MKKAGIMLIIAGILIFIGYVIYQFVIFAAQFNMIIKLALSVSIIGVLIILAVLILERIKDKREEDDDDLSKY